MCDVFQQPHSHIELWQIQPNTDYLAECPKLNCTVGLDYCTNPCKYFLGTVHSKKTGNPEEVICNYNEQMFLEKARKEYGKWLKTK